MFRHNCRTVADESISNWLKNRGINKSPIKFKKKTIKTKNVIYLLIFYALCPFI